SDVQWWCCSPFTPTAHLSPQNLLARRAYYQLDRDSQRCYTPADICMSVGCTSVGQCGVLPGSFGARWHGARHVRDWANLLCFLGAFTPAVKPSNGFLLAESDPAPACRVLPRRILLPLSSGI